MKKYFVLLIISLFFVSVLNSQTKTIVLSQDKSILKTAENSIYGFKLNTNLSEIKFKKSYTSKGGFVQITADNLVKTFGKGIPDLPVFSKLIEVPQNAKVKFKIISYEEQIIDLKKEGISDKIFPAQPSVRKDLSPGDIPFYYNKEIYGSDKFFSAGDIVYYEEAGQMRDTRLGRLEIRPFQYNPVKNKLKVFNNIVIEVKFENADYSKTSELKKKYYSPFFNVPDKSLLYKLPLYTKGLIQSAPATYVIVSPPAFRDTLQDFIRWKTLKGFKVIEAYTDNPEVGNTVSSIKAYLQNLYENPPIETNPPSFILVVGDIDLVPATQHSEVSSSPYSDLDLAEYTGDYLPEVNFGRWSADNATQVANIAAKTIRYERLEMSDISYLTQTLLVAGNDETYEDTYGGGAIYYADYYYLNSNNNINSHTFLQSTIETWPGGNTQAHDSIIANINNGVSLANYTAHCSSDGWSDPTFSQSDLNYNINNIDKFGIWIGNCCQSNMFNVNEAFGELAIRKENAGVIGYIGGSQYSYWDEDYYWGVGVAAISANPTYENSTEGCYDGLFHNKANEINDLSSWYITNYQIIESGNLAVQSSTSSLKDYYWVIYQLAGDPSVVSFVGTPQPMTVSTNPSAIVLGVTSLEVTAAPYAYVALSQNGVLISVATADETGLATLNFDSSVLSLGTADLTVTAQNKIPYFGTLNVISPNEPTVLFYDFGLNISPEYDSSPLITVTLKNYAETGSGYDAFNTFASLSSSDPYVTITDNTESYGTIAAGDLKTSDNAFAIKIADNIPDQYRINFTLTVTGEDSSGNTYSWVSGFYIKVDAPDISAEPVFITNDDNNNGILDPGETADINITVTNTGHASSLYKGILTVDNTYLFEGNTVSAPEIIEPGTSKTFTFSDFSADINTPTETVSVIQAEIKAGYSEQYSKTYNNDITIGLIPVYTVNQSGTYNICTGKFYDSGSDTQNYQDNENYTITFMPASEGDTTVAEFTYFNIESGYDFLYIYQGQDTNSPQITGSPFTGTSNPGIIKSATGLTFKFTSDYSVNYPGWEALISCSKVSTAINYPDKDPSEQTEIIPNPNNGIFTVKTNDANNKVIEIYSVSGKLIYQSKINSTSFNIDLSDKSKGVYFIKIIADNRILNSKLIIK